MTLVLENEWREKEKEAASRAADAWNSKFGTGLELESDERGVYQRVTMKFTDDGCMNDRFRRTHARATIEPPEIRVCPATAGDRRLLFETLRHELGHILGIDRHAKSESAVMAPIATQKRHWFQEEDAELFFTANPSFTPLR